VETSTILYCTYDTCNISYLVGSACSPAPVAFFLDAIEEAYNKDPPPLALHRKEIRNKKLIYLESGDPSRREKLRNFTED
jgi:hypothetical protein